MSDPRKYTNLLLDEIENGQLCKDTVLRECLSYMSESDVQDMMERADFCPDEEEETDGNV